MGSAWKQVWNGMMAVMVRYAAASVKCSLTVKVSEATAGQRAGGAGRSRGREGEHSGRASLYLGLRCTTT